MAVDIKNFVIEQIKNTNPNIDTRPGSVIRDLLVNPLTLVLQGYHLDHKNIVDRQSVKDISSLSNDELDAVAANFLVTRNTGQRSRGYVRLYFSSPRALTIPKGTRFTSDTGTIFETDFAFAVTRLQMEQNTVDFPNYDTGQIAVTAVQAGEGGNVPANTTFTLNSTLASTPAKINTLVAFTGGTASESNDAFFDRLLDTINNKSLAAPTAIKSAIKDFTPSVVDVDVIGAGHPLMIRDLTTLAEQVSNFKVHDFSFTYSGIHDGPYDKKHKALTGDFIDVDTSADVAFPGITGWISEFSNDMYQGLYKLNDMEYAEESTQVIVREFFEDVVHPDAPQPDLVHLATSGQWQFHDGINNSNQMFYLDEISVTNKKLKLGKTMDPLNVDAQLQIPLAMLSGIYDLAGSVIEGTTEEAYNQLGNLIAIDNFNNTSPIFHKPITQHLGIRIQCQMSTTDGTEDGEMAYVTVLRNSEKYLPHDGYGLAWRKQPEYLLRINNNTHTEADKIRFLEEYSVDEAEFNTCVGNLSSESKKAYWKYNVYLVDNDILQEEVWIGHDQLWDQTSGRNQFLQAAKMWIEPNITYNIKMKIYPHLAFCAWMWPDGVTYDENTHKLLDRGQTFPPYVPASGDTVTYSNGLEFLDASRNHFGVAVAQTRNYEWTLDDIVINSFVESFPMHLFRFKPDQTFFNPAKDATVIYHGVGYDPVRYALAGNTGNSKVKLGVYNVAEAKWQTLGTNLATIDDDRAIQKIQKTISPLSYYTDAEGFVNVAATAANSGPDFVDNVEHNLRTYHVEINNVAAGGIHRGNAVDIYVHDPKNIAVGSATAVMDGELLNVWTMPGVSKYIQEILEVREYTSQLSLDNSNWNLNFVGNGTAFGSKANPQISFDLDNMAGTLVEVVYRYWTAGQSVSDLLNNPDTRYPAADQMVKVMPPARIKINRLSYSGGLSSENMREVVADYFNNLIETSFDKSDLVNLLYENGATYVDLNIEIFIYQYNTEGVRQVVPMTSNSYRIPVTTVSRFYATVSDLQGVIRT